MSLSLFLVSRSGSIVDPWTTFNINYARIRIASAEKQDALGCSSYVALVSHVCAATTKGDSPYLRKYPYKEGVGTTHCQMPLHAVGP